MNTKTNIDNRTTAARAAKAYITATADLFALTFTAGRYTEIRLYTAEKLLELFKCKEARTAFKLERDGIRWKGLQVMHVPAPFKNAHVLAFTLNIPYRDLPVGSNSTRSEALEQRIAAELNRHRGWACRWTATEPAEGYQPDITLQDGRTVEVKGLDGRL